MAGEVDFDALGEEAFAATLTAAGEGRASAFSRHARAKAVLAFTGAFGSLQGAFHSSKPTRGMGAGRLGRERRLSIAPRALNHICQQGLFLK